jgi:hypothetical protein
VCLPPSSRYCSYGIRGRERKSDFGVSTELLCFLLTHSLACLTLLGTMSYADCVRGGASSDHPAGVDTGRVLNQVGALQAGQGSGVADFATKVTQVLEHQPSTVIPHPTKPLPDESLPEGFTRSYAGFLLKGGNREIEVDQDVVEQEMQWLQNFAVIACFLGGTPPAYQLRNWLETLKVEVGVVTLGRTLGHGFFILRAQDTAVVRALLLLTPWRSRFGMCVFQKWVPGFDPHEERGGNLSAAPQGMKIPTWITLRKVPEEFIGVAEQIAQGIGDLLGVDAANNSSSDQRFCVGLDGKGWEPSVTVKNKKTGKNYIILIDYNFLPIRCRFCLDTQHSVKDCPAKPATRPARTNRHQHTPNDRKTQGAQDHSRKEKEQLTNQAPQQNTSPATKAAGWTEVRSRNPRSGPRTGFKSQWDVRPPEGSQGTRALPTSARSSRPTSDTPSLAQSTKTPSSPNQVPALPTSPVNIAMGPTVGPSSEVPPQLTTPSRTEEERRPVEHPDTIPSTQPGGITEADAIMDMNWSPRKLAGKKRTLEIEHPQEGTAQSQCSNQSQMLEQDLNSMPTGLPGSSTPTNPTCAYVVPTQELNESSMVLGSELPMNATYTASPTMETQGDSSIHLMQSLPEVTGLASIPEAATPLLAPLLQVPELHRQRFNELLREVTITPLSVLPRPTLESFTVVPPLTPQEAHLIARLDHQDPLQLSLRDTEGLDGIHSAPRTGRAVRRLQDHSSRYRHGVWRAAAPYGDGIQRTRREIDFRVPHETPGAYTLTRISESPRRELSPTCSLPWAE